ncbi:hypothetical protein [Streptomyces rhizosphaericus]|nr:hypothetical protein [Streptomyces rhizosphaericus]
MPLYDADLADGAKVVGNIYPAGGTGAAHRNVLFPCGSSATAARYDVHAGHYIVSATLPSGAVLSEDAEAQEGQETRVALDASGSPYETYAWQYLMGNIEPYSVYHGTGDIPVPRSSGSRITGAPGREFTAPAHAVWIGNPARNSWSFASMLALAHDTPHKPMADLMAESPPCVISRPDATDETCHLFRFGPDGPVSTPVDPLPHGPRQFLVVRPAAVPHIVTLPVPWDSALIEVLVNDRRSPTGSPISVTVRDNVLGPALGYMARGALDAAATLVKDAAFPLDATTRNPLVAAAGAYVLMGTELSNRTRRRNSWLSNLRDRADWMSDGSVLWAVQQLRQARTDAELRRARDGLIEAYDRGVPIYTLGLSHLMDGLSEFPDDRECARRLDQARRLSWRVDMREPFVIVRSRGRLE